METQPEGSRRLIVWNLMTLNGFFEGPNKWDLDWHNDVWGEELERFSLEQLASADLLLFGRVTYQGMAAYWPTAQGEGEVAEYMNRIPKLVFSRTLESADWNNTRLVKDGAMEAVARLKQQAGKNILVFGSADLVAALLRHGLVDEYRIGLAPVVLGSGNPLFKASPEKLKMKLVDAKPLSTGCVILSYRPEGTK